MSVILTYEFSPYVMLGKRKPKRQLLGQNWYKKAHWSKQDEAKKQFALMVFDETAGSLDAKLTNVKVNFKYIPPKNKNFDLDNIDAVVRKFFLDGYKQMGYIEDDNRKIVKKLCAEVGETDWDAKDIRVIITVQGELDV